MVCGMDKDCQENSPICRGLYLRRSFEKRLFYFKVETVEIPYEGTILSGYYYHLEKQNTNDKNMERIGDANQAGSEKRIRKFDIPSSNNSPTLLVHEGFDSILEELYAYAAAPALERGYNCLTFEGPGQGEVIRKQTF